MPGHASIHLTRYSMYASVIPVWRVRKLNATANCQCRAASMPHIRKHVRATRIKSAESQCVKWPGQAGQDTKGHCDANVWRTSRAAWTKPRRARLGAALSWFSYLFPRYGCHQAPVAKTAKDKTKARNAETGQDKGAFCFARAMPDRSNMAAQFAPPVVACPNSKIHL